MATKQTDDETPSLKDFLDAVNKATQTVHTAAKFIPDMDDAQLRKLSREKLSEALQAIDPVQQPGMTKALCAEMKDRLDGKAAQSVQLDATVRQVIVNATIKFADAPQHVVIDQLAETQDLDNE